MFTEEVNDQIAALLEGADNSYNVRITISHDKNGVHYNVHIGGWIGNICTSGSGQSRLNLEDALNKAIASRSQIGHKG